MTTRRQRNIPEDTEISVEDDVQPKNRRKGKKVKKNQKVVQEGNDDIFAGIDLEGVPEDEKEQLRQAILASKQDADAQAPVQVSADEIESTADDTSSVPDVSDDDILAEKDKTLTDSSEELELYQASTQKDKSSQDREKKTPDEQENHDEEALLEKELDDDAIVLTEDEDAILDLTKSTLNDDDDDDDETQPPDSPVERIQETTLEDNTDDSNEDLNDTVKSASQRMNEPSRPTSEKLIENQTPRVKSACIKTDSQGSDHDERSKQTQSSGNLRGQRSAQRSSQRSGSSDSQGSAGFVPTVTGSNSQNSQSSQKSLSSDEPLVRHYRAVIYKPQRGPSYYCPEGVDPKTYIKVISQLIDTYHRELERVQKTFREKIPWGETVKPGQHHPTTIDAKRRGHTVQVFDITELDDDDNDFKAGPSMNSTKNSLKDDSNNNIKPGPSINLGRKFVNDSDDDFVQNVPRKTTKRFQKVEQNSDDDLPELIIEDSPERSNSVNDGNINIKSRHVHGTGTTQRFTAEQAADIITSAIEEETGVNNGVESESIRKVPVRSNSTKKDRLGPADRSGENEGARKKRKLGPRKGAQKILVPETQDEDHADDLFDMLKKQKLDAVVEETQFVDEAEWLNVSDNPEKLVDNIKRQKLKGYKIPHINKDSDKSNTNDNNARQANNKARSSRKEKTKPKVIVEETQNFGFDELVNESKGGKRKVKQRQCFSIDSVSSDDDESVAETQLDHSPIGGHEEEVGESEKENKPQGFFAKVKSTVETVKNFFTTPEEKKNDHPQKSDHLLKDDHSQEDPESPVIKRSRTRKLYTASTSKFDTHPSQQVDKSEISSEMNHPSAGQKKSTVFGRNPSKDSILSNNSDDVSVASSQVSTTLLDDNGDLYSTQFHGMVDGKRTGRKRKATNQHNDCDNENTNPAASKVKNVQNMDCSDDDEVMVLDIDNENKAQADKTDIKKVTTSTSKRQKIIRIKKIDEHFKKGRVSPEDKVVDKSFSPEDLGIHVQRNVITGDTSHPSENDFMDENPFPKTYSTHNLKGAKKINNNFGENTSDLRGNSGGSQEEDSSGAHRNPNKQFVNKKRLMKLQGWVTEAMGPVDLQNFAGTSQSREPNQGQMSRSQGRRGQSESRHRKEVFNLDPDEADISEDENMQPGTKTSNTPVEMIDCPMCSKQFSTDTIQQHAENCQGPPEEEAEAQPDDDDPSNFEMDTCCICEKQVLKSVLERHVQECWARAEQLQKQQQEEREEPVQTRRTRNTPDRHGPQTPSRRNRQQRDSPIRYLPDTNGKSDSEGSTVGSSWEEDSDTSGSDDHITLKSIAMSGSAALVDGPWNQSKKTVVQSNGLPSDWMIKGSNSPIKSFVPISKQEDADYYHKQFNYNKERVEKRQAKRKRDQGKSKRKTKRRKVTKRKKKS